MPYMEHLLLPRFCDMLLCTDLITLHNTTMRCVLFNPIFLVRMYIKCSKKGNVLNSEKTLPTLFT